MVYESSNFFYPKIELIETYWHKKTAIRYY